VDQKSGTIFKTPVTPVYDDKERCSMSKCSVAYLEYGWYFVYHRI